MCSGWAFYIYGNFSSWANKTFEILAYSMTQVIFTDTSSLIKVSFFTLEKETSENFFFLRELAQLKEAKSSSHISGWLLIKHKIVSCNFFAIVTAATKMGKFQWSKYNRKEQSLWSEYSTELSRKLRESWTLSIK